MLVRLFGGRWSPSVSNFALRKIADDNKDLFDAETVKTVHRNFHVDDLLKSVKTIEDAKKLYEYKLTLMLASGRFHLTKWICNSREVPDVIPQSEMASQLRNLSFDTETLPTERALGLEWNAESDCFQFNISQKDKPHTRRGILSMVSSIFDPLGFVVPFVLSDKIILQRLCKKGLGWDEIIPEKDLSEWQKWVAKLPKLEQLKVNRCFHPPEFGDITKSQHHHFSEAFELGYGAVSYLRSVNSHGNINCSSVMGKSRLAPVKPRTIPRPELSAATTAVRLDTMIKQELDAALDTSVFWTDSIYVLRYMNNEKKRFRTFVANRISVIRDASEPNQWNYVSNRCNTADDAARGLSADALLESNRWIKGPDFLWQNEDSWLEDVFVLVMFLVMTLR